MMKIKDNIRMVKIKEPQIGLATISTAPLLGMVELAINIYTVQEITP